MDNELSRAIKRFSFGILASFDEQGRLDSTRFTNACLTLVADIRKIEEDSEGGDSTPDSTV